MKHFLNEALHDSEPLLEERIQIAKERARKIANSKLDSEDDLRLYLCYYIGSKYNLPIFSNYFDARTIDELMFEAELLSLKDRPQEQLASDITNEHKEEADALFDDWAEEDQQWVEVSNPMTPEFEEMAKKFMQTNEFKE